ncbi:Berardinelli-Seip congenital lipodystrophy 2 (seipin) [Mactra antiquata]
MNDEKNFPETLKLKVNGALSTINDVAKQVLYSLATLSAIIWFSVFLYGTFYFYLVPVVTQEMPVYFHFRVCDHGIGMCSFPTANITMSKEGTNELFNVGQSYKIVLDLDIPESDTNRQIGMFMIELSMYNKHGNTVQRSARAVSTSLHYKSELLRIIETLVFSPFFLFGYMNQKQMIHVELFPDFKDNAFDRSAGLVVEIQSMKAEIYTANLRVFAQFSGIRYFLYYWPVTSAVIGISWNFMVVSFITLLSWYQFWLPREQDDKTPRIKINLFRNRKRTPTKKTKGELDRPTETLRPKNVDDNTSLLLPGASTAQDDEGLRLRRPHSDPSA